MKHYRNILFWFFSLTFVIVSLSFVKHGSSDLVCKNINVVVIDSLENSFVGKKEIVSIMFKYNPHLIGDYLEGINADIIEEEIVGHSSVLSSQVYKTINGDINVLIDQRNPVIRILPERGKGIYIDESGMFMPLNRNFSSHIIIASGNISLNINLNKTPDISSVKDKKIEDLYKIGKFLSMSKFWNSQIEQIYVLPNGEFELVPRVGAQIILLGTSENLENKLRNLKAVYLKGFNKHSWSKYNYINLKFYNQVVCTKR